MGITNITIKKLFGLFDYDIDFNQTEQLTILTGPNGYGKTTILNIINNLFNQNFLFFQKLIFDEILISLSGGLQIQIHKDNFSNREEEQDKIQLPHRVVSEPKNSYISSRGQVYYNDVVVSIIEDDKPIVTNYLNAPISLDLRRSIDRHPLAESSLNKYIDYNKRDINYENYINDNFEALPDHIIELIKAEMQVGEELQSIFSSQNVYLIKEQRLLKQREYQVDRYGARRFHSLVNTIEENAEELSKHIELKQLEALKVTQRLDSSFPNRLISNKKKISKEEFDEKYSKLIEKQNQLQKYGVSVSQQNEIEYDESSANVLYVYIEDTAEKLSIYDDLLQKINLFVNILNQKEFINKTIHIDAKYGFYFKSDNGEVLNLADLSSGEQHEVVLLYELLFNTDTGALILIDEPEISLHVIWQKAFINDLEEIAKIKDISFLISTHSPQIVNNRWDITRDLFELSRKNE